MQRPFDKLREHAHRYHMEVALMKTDPAVDEFMAKLGHPLKSQR